MSGSCRIDTGPALTSATAALRSRTEPTPRQREYLLDKLHGRPPATFEGVAEWTLVTGVEPAPRNCAVTSRGTGTAGAFLGFRA